MLRPHHVSNACPVLHDADILGVRCEGGRGLLDCSNGINWSSFWRELVALPVHGRALVNVQFEVTRQLHGGKGKSKILDPPPPTCRVKSAHVSTLKDACVGHTQGFVTEDTVRGFPKGCLCTRVQTYCVHVGQTDVTQGREADVKCQLWEGDSCRPGGEEHEGRDKVIISSLYVTTYA